MKKKKKKKFNLKYSSFISFQTKRAKQKLINSKFQRKYSDI